MGLHNASVSGASMQPKTFKQAARKLPRILNENSDLSSNFQKFVTITTGFRKIYKNTR